jgi:hypothetical protein
MGRLQIFYRGADAVTSPPRTPNTNTANTANTA